MRVAGRPPSLLWLLWYNLFSSNSNQTVFRGGKMDDVRDKLDVMMDALVEGAEDGLNGWVDEPRCKIDPAYYGGVKMGMFKYAKFIESTVDHLPGHVFPDVPMVLWMPFLNHSSATKKPKTAKRDRTLVRLEGLNPDLLLSVPAARYPFDENFVEQLDQPLAESEIFHKALC